MKSRAVACPACKKEITSKFKEEDLLVGGKNQFCPHCGFLLWLPSNPLEEPTVLPKKRISEARLT